MGKLLAVIRRGALSRGNAMKPPPTITNNRSPARSRRLKSHPPWATEVPSVLGNRSPIRFGQSKSHPSWAIKVPSVLGSRSPVRRRQSNGRTRRKLSPVRQRANVRSKNSTINTRNRFLPQMSTIPTEVEDARFHVPSGNATQAGWISEAESGEDEAAGNRSPSEGARFVRASQRQKQSRRRQRSTSSESYDEATEYRRRHRKRDRSPSDEGSKPPDYPHWVDSPGADRYSATIDWLSLVRMAIGFRPKWSAKRKHDYFMVTCGPAMQKVI
jgi:hypothetical protein